MRATTAASVSDARVTAALDAELARFDGGDGQTPQIKDRLTNVSK